MMLPIAPLRSIPPIKTSTTQSGFTILKASLSLPSPLSLPLLSSLFSCLLFSSSAYSCAPSESTTFVPNVAYEPPTVTWHKVGSSCGLTGLTCCASALLQGRTSPRRPPTPPPTRPTRSSPQLSTAAPCPTRPRGSPSMAGSRASR